MQKATFGAALRELRVRRGFSVRTLARALGTSRSYIRELERDETRPSVTRINQLADLLNANAEHLTILTGRVPEDILAALQNDPSLINAVRNAHR